MLLLDDDEAFRETIRDYLTENGYTVIAVDSGTAGIQEALASEFALVLCDMMMPELPGDLFYRAIERVHPKMRERFVFMTGHREDARTKDFIRSINGYVLQKPFPLQYLLDSIAVAEVRSTCVSIFDRVSREPAPAEMRQDEEAPAKRAVSLPPAPRAADEEPAPAHCAPSPAESSLPPLQTVPRPSEIPAPAPAQRVASASQGFASGGPRVEARPGPHLVRVLVPAGLAILAVLVVNLAVRVPKARDRAMTAAAERRALEAERTNVSAQLQEAADARANSASLRDRAKRLADLGRHGEWTDALRAIASAGATDTMVQSIAAHGTEGPRGGCQILLRGGATGRTPAETVNIFLETLRHETEQAFTGAVVARLASLEESQDAAGSDQRRASFTITVGIDSNEKRTKEGGARK